MLRKCFSIYDCEVIFWFLVQLFINILLSYINRTEAVTFCRNLHKAEKEEIKSMDGAMLS